MAVEEELERIASSAALEEDAEKVSFKELFSCKSTRSRIVIATSLQCLQQATGINPMFTYGGILFQSIIPSGGIISLLVLQIVNFLSTFPALIWVDKFGRRSLLLLGATGMVLGHICAATFFTVGCSTDSDENTTCSDASGIAIVSCAAFFIFNFAISWGPVCWIYPAEIFPTRIRAKAVALSTMTNWGMGALMIGIPKLFPLLDINGVFFLFGVLCTGAGIFAYVYCPETKGVALEEIEKLFQARKTNAVVEMKETNNGFSIVHTPSVKSIS